MTRRYAEDTLVLETTFRTRDGTLVLEDALALGRGERAHALGMSSPGLLLRRLAWRAMTYAPTGAIVAATTTSLPESVGGERNWDYRYTWVRDASFTVHALNTATCEEEETAFFTFLSRTCATQPTRTRTFRSCTASAASAT